jgi:hypothetical protein
MIKEATSTDEQIIAMITAGNTVAEITTECHCGKSRIKRIKKTMGVSTPAPKQSKGLEGFRNTFDSTIRNAKAMDEFLGGDEFAEVGYIADNELSRRLGISGIQWAELRNLHENHIVEVKDPVSRTRKKMWCHPDIINECRDIARRS